MCGFVRAASRGRGRAPIEARAPGSRGTAAPRDGPKARALCPAPRGARDGHGRDAGLTPLAGVTPLASRRWPAPSSPRLAPPWCRRRRPSPPLRSRGPPPLTRRSGRCTCTSSTTRRSSTTSPTGHDETARNRRRDCKTAARCPSVLFRTRGRPYLVHSTAESRMTGTARRQKRPKRRFGHKTASRPKRRSDRIPSPCTSGMPHAAGQSVPTRWHRR